jgi:hypothetical protein
MAGMQANASYRGERGSLEVVATHPAFEPKVQAALVDVGRC